MNDCSDERCKKKAKQEEAGGNQAAPPQDENYAGFDSLPTDVLISILCRSPASDHKSLRDTCKSFRATIDSDAYKGERASSGWAEVSTHLLTGGELYDRHFPNGPSDVELSDDEIWEGDTEEQKAATLKVKKMMKRDDDMHDYGYSSAELGCHLGCRDQDYGYHDITVDVNVDGERCGAIRLVLLPRGTDHNYPFHDATDAHSSELQEVGWALCDSAGRLKVRSIKDAELISGEAGRGGFLHIISVRISEAYRQMDCTNVVAKAVRSALSDRKLEGKWTLATAISDYEVYHNKEEMEFRRRIRYDDEVTSEEKERAQRRYWDCAVLDTKTLLRVGLKQIPETVSEKHSPYWLFAVPSFLHDPIKSFEEVDQAPLIEPPDLPEPTGYDAEILEIMKQKCNAMRQMQEHVRSEKLELDKIQQANLFEAVEREIEEAKTVIEAGKPDNISDERWREMIAKVETLEATLRESNAKIEEVIQRQRDKLNDLIDSRIPGAAEELQTKLIELVRKGGSIRRSNAIHCCSRLRITQFLDFLVNMVPPEERAQALSSLDSCGLTPLHCVVLGTPEVRDRDEYVDFVERLMGMGADTNVKSARGVTPLGQYRLTMTDKFEYGSVFGMRSGDEPEGWRPFHRKMEGLLMPSKGETDADVEAKCAVLDNDVNSEESGDDEGDAWMEDDDEDGNEDDSMMDMDEDNGSDDDEEEGE